MRQSGVGPRAVNMSFGERLGALMPNWLKTWFSSKLNKILFPIYIIILAFFIFDIFIFSFVTWIWNGGPQVEPGLMKPECQSDGFRKISFTLNNVELKMVKVYVLYSEPKKFGPALEFCLGQNASLWDVRSREEWEAVSKYVAAFAPMDIWLNGKVEGQECPSGQDCMNNQTDQGRGLSVRWFPDQTVGSYSRLYRGETTEKKCLVVETSQDLFWTTGYCDYEEHIAVCVKRDCWV